MSRVEIVNFVNFYHVPILFVQDFLKQKMNKNTGKKGISKLYLNNTCIYNKEGAEDPPPQIKHKTPPRTK